MFLSELDEAQSVTLLEEASKAENLALAAEENAGEYAAIAELRESQSIKDGKGVLKSEVGAAEDVEVMAACTPIPVLNVFCDAVGLVIESGYQSVAAIKGAKAGVEAISAGAAQRKEHAELVLAMEQQEETARFASEAEELQVKADGEASKATIDESGSDIMRGEAGEADMLVEEKLAQSEKEEALATFDEEVRR